MARQFNLASAHYATFTHAGVVGRIGSFACWSRPSFSGSDPVLDPPKAMYLFVAGGPGFVGMYYDPYEYANSSLVLTADGWLGGFANTTATWTADEWHHFGGSWNSNSGSEDVALFLDGAEITKDAHYRDDPAAGLPSSTVYIARRFGANECFWDGALADVAFWDERLTAAEYAALYRGSRPWDIRPGALRASWAMDSLSPETVEEEPSDLSSVVLNMANVNPATTGPPVAGRLFSGWSVPEPTVVPDPIQPDEQILAAYMRLGSRPRG